MNRFSLNEDISLNEYNFIEWTDKFLEMNIIPWTNIIASNDYTFCEKIYFLWMNWSPLQLTSISFPWSWINTISSRYTVAGCKVLPWLQIYFVECEYVFLEFCIICQVWVVTRTDTNYDLLVLCVPCEQRPLVYHEKQSPFVSQREMLRWPHDKSATEICFFTKTSDRGCNLCGRLGKQTSGN